MKLANTWQRGAVVSVFGFVANAAPVHAEEHAAGRAVYDKWCAPCHSAGITHPGTHALTAKYQGTKSGVLLDWTDLPSERVHYMVRHGMSIMPMFRKTEISDAELDALAKFLARKTPK